MQFANKISTSIKNNDVEEILSQINKIDKKLKNLVALSDEERQSIPHMGNATVSFVFDVLEKAKRYPELIPEEVDLEEIQKDADLIASINKVYKPLKDLIKKLEDSALVASSEAYFPALAIFNSITNANRKNKMDSRASFDNYPRTNSQNVQSKLKHEIA